MKKLSYTLGLRESTQGRTNKKKIRLVGEVVTGQVICTLRCTDVGTSQQSVVLVCSGLAWNWGSFGHRQATFGG